MIFRTLSELRDLDPTTNTNVGVARRAEFSSGGKPMPRERPEGGQLS